MQSAFIVNDRAGKPYAVVALLAGGTEFYPIAEGARSWAGWMKDEFASKKITKQELAVTLDNSMEIQGPMIANRANKFKIDELLKKAKKPASVDAIESAKEPETKSAQLVPVISIMDARLDNLDNDEWRNAVNFKAKSFILDVNKSTFAYEVKRTRAVWDASLRIPGTERSGGWRCPTGTRYGGQITDRFGRNCGWGVARRLANEISDLGERLENVGDRRRERRVNRRNQRMIQRLQQGGRVERGARRVAEALETGTGPQPQRRQRGTGLVERVARGVAGALESGTPERPRRQRRGNERQERPGILERAAGAVGRALESDEGTPERKPAPRRRPAAPRAPQARPARPRQPRRPRDENRPAPRAPQDNVSGIPVPAGAPNPGESLRDYKNRKYNEHQANVRQIREQGGRAGFLRRAEWEAFHGPAVEEAWNRANPRANQRVEVEGAWLRTNPNVDPRTEAQPRPSSNRGRSARRVATDAGAARSASRRPRPQDAPEPRQPAARRRRPFDAPNQRGLASEQAARRKRVAMERDNPNKEYKLVKHNNKYYVVEKDAVDRANARGANLEVVNEPPRRPAAPVAPVAPTNPPSPPTPPSSGPGRTGTRNKRRPLANLVKGKKNDGKLGNIGRDGLPDAQRVEIGNAGINTKDDAVRHLGNGGDLKDVPDEFLHDAMKNNSGPGKRFTVRNVGGGVNGIMPVYKDSRTGKEYFVKYVDKRAYAHNEDLNEIIGNNIAARLGFPVGEFRFAGPAYRDMRGQGRPIIFEHVDNYIDGSVGPPNGKIKSDDVIAATIFDYLLLNTDRHKGNYMMVIQNGERRFVPIDPSLGFNARVFNGDMADAGGFRNWVNHHIGGGRNSMLDKLRADIRSGAVPREDALRMVARLQEQLRGSERERPYLDFAQKAAEAAGALGGDARENISPQTTAANARIQWLISQSPENILREIAG